MSTTTPTRPSPSGPTRKKSVMPYVFLAIAIVSVLASLLMWKHQHDHKTTPGTPVIATGKPTNNPSSGSLAIQVVRAPGVWQCSPGGDNRVILTWSVTGASAVDVYIDGASTPFLHSSSLASQTEVPAPCAPASHTYTVKATAAGGQSVSKSTTTKGV